MKDRGSVEVVALGILAATVVAIVAFMIVVGSGPRLETGRVVAKVYDDADEWYQPGYTIHGSETCSGGYNGQPRTCSRSADVHIPGQWHYERERFLLELEGPHPDKPAETIEDTISVPESFWGEVREGQWVDTKTLEIIPR